MSDLDYKQTYEDSWGASETSASETSAVPGVEPSKAKGYEVKPEDQGVATPLASAPSAYWAGPPVDLDPVSGPEGAAKTAGTQGEGAKKVRVTTHTNLHSEANAKPETLCGKVAIGSVLPVQGQDGDWYKIGDDLFVPVAACQPLW